MKVLIITQVVDTNDPGLGFFHNWIKKLAPKFAATTVIGLQVGEYDLPGVKVLSLGKPAKGWPASGGVGFPDNLLDRALRRYRHTEH